MPAIGPKIRKAITENTSAGSKRKNGNMGNGGCILAGNTTVETAANPPNAAPPVKLTLRLANRASAMQTTESSHNKLELLNFSIMTIS
jgi:hypothetical protein